MTDKSQQPENLQRQPLLIEYQTCQSEINSSKSHYWITVGIFMGINTAILGMVASGIISAKTSLIGIYIPYLVLGLGLAVILLLISLWFWLNRTNFNIRLTYARMREIETQLGMLKNLTIHWVEHPNDTPKEQEERINSLRNQYMRGLTLRGVYCVGGMYLIVGLLWIFFIIMTFIVFYP